jgi:3-dehydroquinate synthase class II
VDESNLAMAVADKGTTVVIINKRNLEEVKEFTH